MDANGLKGRIAEALVEGIFRRARYQVALVGRESRVQQMLKIGSSEFVPDLLVWKHAAESAFERPLHRLVAIEVKYRADVERFLPRVSAKFARAGDQWPDLYFVFVTDHPGPGRSCFQAVDVRQCSPGVPWVTLDLHEVPELDIYWKTIEEYQSLVKLIFPILSASARAEPPARKPEAKVSARVAPLRAAR